MEPPGQPPSPPRSSSARGRPVVHAFDDELARLDAVATAQAIADRELSAQEVLTAAIDRAQRLDPTLEAIASERFDAATPTSHPPTVGGLAGVPTFIKEMVDVAGLPTRFGSPALAAAAPARRSRVIAHQIEQMGMPILGTSAMPEFGFICTAESGGDAPFARNPWNLDRSVGGSSSGAAALVASGVVPIAHAADGGGSTRIPAACAGLVGLKPSRGRLIGHREERPLPVSPTVDGVHTRTVRDTARFFALAEQLRRPRHLPPMGEITRPVRRRLRIGAFIDIPDVDAPVDAAVRASFADTLTLLGSLGHHVEETAPPVGRGFGEDFLTYFSILAHLSVLSHAVQPRNGITARSFTPFTQQLARRGRSNWRSLPAVVRRLRGVRAQIEAAHGAYDVVLSPTVTTLAPVVGHLTMGLDHEVVVERIQAWQPYTPVHNIAGTPAISLPLGRDRATNLPIGMHFAAPFGHDALLVALALELEDAQPWTCLP